jgi:RNA polymerase sigma-70 factor (ECF subfamily)
MSYVRQVELSATFPPFVWLQRLFGFVPNVFRAQALLPRIIEAEAGLASAVLLEEQALSRTRKEFILLAVAAANQNPYWVTEHHQMLRLLGLPERQLDEIVTDRDKAGISTLDLELLDFALKLAKNAPWVSGEDISRLRAQGFNDEAVLEAILVTALANFFCTLSTGLGPMPDFALRVPNPVNIPRPDPGSYVGGTSGPYLSVIERSPDTFPPFAYFVERFGSIPNIFHAQTLRPEAIEAEAGAFRNVLQPEDLLSHVQKECILLVVSAANLNTYCVAAHCEMLRMMGLSTAESDQIAVDHHQAEISEENKRLLDFVLKLAVRPSEFGREDIDGLRRCGFTEEHILEAIAVTGLNNFINTLQMGLGTTPDIEPRRVFGPQDAHLLPSGEHQTDSAQGDADAAFVTKVRDGDSDAFEELVTRHERRVYRTLVSITGDAEEAQDAMQDTFLKAFQNIGNFQGRSKFSTWLLAIATNVGIQRLRERRRFGRIEEHGPEAEEEFRPRHVRPWADDPEQLYSQAERRGLVESALLTLPPKYRVVLVLRDLEQLSGEETAAALGLGIAAMKARLFRARMMLRESLSPHFASTAKRMVQ